MTFDSLLALAGLVVAIYALLPEYRRLDLKLRMTRLDWAVAVSALALVHYLQFYEAMQSLGLTPSLGLRRWGVYPSNASYLVVAAASAFLWLRMRYSRLSRRQLPRLERLVEELLWQGRYAELISLLKRYLLRIASRFPDEQCSREIMRATLTRPEFVRAVARTEPYFVLLVLPLNLQEIPDFVNIYFSESLSTPSSAFCSEIRNNQDLLSGDRYAVPSSNRILYHLLSKAHVARDLAVYRPIGETVIRELQVLRHRGSPDPHLRPVGLWSEDEFCDSQWESPVFVGIRFFDIMVAEAMYQDVDWHMWLYYFPDFTREILVNYSEDGDGIDPLAEWPTRYSYLLYQIVRTHRNWIRSVSELPEGNRHKSIRTPRLDHENDNIPKSAVLSLAQCLEMIGESAAVGEALKRYLFEIPLRLYFELRRQEAAGLLAECLLNGISQSGSSEGPSSRYQDCVQGAFSALDKVPFPGPLVRELEQALTTRFRHRES